MIVDADKFLMRNYLDGLDSESAKEAVHTELVMKPAEFDHFRVDEEGQSLTFCLKELKSLLAFADAFALNVSSAFESGGDPISFSLSWALKCEARLIMSTLDGGDEVYRLKKPSKVKKTVTSTSNDDVTSMTDNVEDSVLLLNDDDSVVVEAPASKRARFIFKKCFEETFNPDSIPGAKKILAPDSDEED